MTTDTALRLERLFGMPTYMWMGLQQAYDVAVASRAIDLSHQTVQGRRVAGLLQHKGQARSIRA